MVNGCENVENLVEKGESGNSQHFLLSHKVFKRLFLWEELGGGGGGGGFVVFKTRESVLLGLRPVGEKHVTNQAHIPQPRHKVLRIFFSLLFGKPFTKLQSLYCSKLKEFADDYFEFDKNGGKFS